MQHASLNAFCPFHSWLHPPTPPGPRGVPYAVTHDGRTIRYPDPDVKAEPTHRGGEDRWKMVGGGGDERLFHGVSLIWILLPFASYATGNDYYILYIIYTF